MIHKTSSLYCPKIKSLFGDKTETRQLLPLTVANSVVLFHIAHHFMGFIRDFRIVKIFVLDVHCVSLFVRHFSDVSVSCCCLVLNPLLFSVCLVSVDVHDVLFVLLLLNRRSIFRQNAARFALLS